MSHPNKVVIDAVFLYTKAIHYLINNIDEQDRNIKAFELVFDLSQKEIANSKDNNTCCFDMLNTSVKLS